MELGTFLPGSRGFRVRSPNFRRFYRMLSGAVVPSPRWKTNALGLPRGPRNYALKLQELNYLKMEYSLRFRAGFGFGVPTSGGSAGCLQGSGFRTRGGAKFSHQVYIDVFATSVRDPKCQERQGELYKKQIFFCCLRYRAAALSVEKGDGVVRLAQQILLPDFIEDLIHHIPAFNK